MCDTSIILAEFDIHDGPVICRQDGPIVLDENQLNSIKRNSFPESIKPIYESPHIFTFRAHSLYCFASYSSIRDTLAPRGYRQNSFVIVSTEPYFVLFERLLESTTSISSTDADVIFDVLAKFLEHWRQQLGSPDFTSLELPYIDGSFKVSSTAQFSELLNDRSQNSFILNRHFLGSNLSKALQTDKLEQCGRLSDLTQLWEVAVLGRPLLVIGDTPSEVSSAVFAIASLAFPARAPTVYPYISVTDPNFQTVIHSNSIIGVSNPLAVQLAKDIDCFTVGSGFGCAHPCPLRKLRATNYQIRLGFFRNTKKVLDAIDSLLETDHFATLTHQVENRDLTKALQKQEVCVKMNLSDFSSALFQSKLFEWQRKKKVSGILLGGMEMDKVFSGASEGELKKVCAGIVRALRNNCDKGSSVVLKMHLRTVVGLIDQRI